MSTTLTSSTIKTGAPPKVRLAEQPVRAACAPTPLDVMGGLGEAAGALTLTGTLRNWISATVRGASDAQLRVSIPGDSSNGNRAAAAVQLALPMKLFQEARAPSDTHQALLEAIAAQNADQAVGAAAAVHAFCANGHCAGLSDGLSIDVKIGEGGSHRVGFDAAVAAATIAGILGSLIGALNETALLDVVDALSPWPCFAGIGVRLTLAGLVAQAHSLLQYRRQNPRGMSHIELPAGTALAAIEVSPARPIRPERTMESQVAARMGCRIVQHLMKKDGTHRDAASVSLAAVSPVEYVERYRERIPSKITGKNFEEKYGPLEGETLDPAFYYKTRSRAEHIIYENQRVHEFTALLNRARRLNEEAALVEAGELMYASHWSHSQRFGLGSVETDVITQLVRKRGPAQGLYGAKLAGGHTGGLTIVLMKDTPTARALLDDIADQAARQFGSSFRVLTGSDGGAVLQADDTTPTPKIQKPE